VVDELDASFDFGLGLVIAGIENLARRRGASA
jgi:hypothetical protein